MLPANKVKDGYLTSGLPEDAWVPVTPEGSFYLTVMDRVRKHIAEEGDWTLLKNFITKETLMAGDIEPLSKKFSIILEDMGFVKGDSLHACVGNHNYTYSFFGGCWALGGICSCGDIALDPKAIAGQLEDLKARFVICTEETVDRVKQAVAKVEAEGNTKVKVLSFGKVEGCTDVLGLLESVDLESRTPPEPVRFSEEEIKSEVNLVFWSSGTTGLPKGICHTHFSSFNFCGWTEMVMKPNTNTVTTTCFFHVGGFYTGLMAMLKRQTYFHMFGKGLTFTMILDAMAEAKCNQCSIGTHHYVQMSTSDEFLNYDSDKLSYMQTLLPAGAAVPEACAETWFKKMPNLKFILNAYGQSEMGIMCLSADPKNIAFVTCGYTVCFKDPDTGKVLGPNETGEICIKSPSMMKGYLNRKKANDEFFDEEGFGHTGDLGYYDDKGTIFFVDRLKELVKYKNNHVSPTELEDVLQKHSSVKESLVFGIENSEVQEIISAVIVLRPGHEATEDDIREHVNSQVLDYKKIRGPILFRDEIPRNSVGKLVRREMRLWAKNQVPV